MLDRREFLQAAAAGGATLAVSSSAAASAEPVGGGRPAARVLSEHRVAKIESRAMQDRFPRSLGPNGKGHPVGGGGGYQALLQEFWP